MGEKIPLNRMKANETGTVVAFLGGYGMIRNLGNLGIRIGAKIKMVTQHAMGGPVVVSQNRTTVAIGFGMAQKIIVETGTGK